MEPVELLVGESRTVCVVASEKWNASGILIRPGQQFAFEAKGEWNDGGIDCDPGGFAISDAPAISRGLLRLFSGSLRMKSAQYFCLIGSVARANFFAIGRNHIRYTAPNVAGHLELFANDVPLAYFNNSKAIQLVATRVR